MLNSGGEVKVKGLWLLHTYFLMELVEVTVAVLHCPAVLPIPHFDDINLKHTGGPWIKDPAEIKAASHLDGRAS